MYGLLATVCGYGFDQIDAMTMDQFLELSAYWRDHPPLHLLAAAWMGVKPQLRPAASSAPNGLARLLGVDPERGGAMRL